MDAVAAAGRPGVGFRTMRWVLAFTLSLIILSVYTQLSLWNVTRFEAGVPALTLWTPLDRHVPTVPWMVWPYMLYFLLIFAPIFLTRRPIQVAEILTAYLMVSAVAWTAYVVWPVRMVYPPLVCDGLSCRILDGLYRADAGVNVMPSQHAAHAMVAAAVFHTYRSRLTPLVLAAALAVTAAAVLTRQHFVLDVPVGMALGLAGWWLTRLLFQPLKS